MNDWPQKFGRVHRSKFMLAGFGVRVPRAEKPHFIFRRGCWYCTGSLEPTPGVTMVIGRATVHGAIAEYLQRSALFAGMPKGIAS